MKVQELRQLLSASDRENLEKALVETYKQLRKGQKEEFDSLLTDILQGKTVEKKAVEEAVPFEELERQITEFLENAYAQNYFAPNRVIPKSQRPKWRFMVKNYIKELERISSESDYYSRSVKLLTDLYKLICQACNYYLFSTDDPFRSIGWEQQDFFGLLVRKTFAAGYSQEDISSLLLLAATGGLSRESLHIQQELVLLGELKTSDVKCIALEEARKLVDERIQKLTALKKYDDRKYSLEDAVNELCATVLLLSVRLAEPEEGIKYYFQYSRERDKEITLYCALRLMDWTGEDELWIKIYEYGLKKKIEPRDRLKAEYKERKGLV